MALSSTAVFVIDIQRDLVGDAKTEIPHSARIQDAGAKILAAVRELNASSLAKPALLVFVQHEEQPETGPLVKGSEPWELFFNPIADSKHEILVSKTTRSTFESNAGLAAKLKSQGINKIVVFGVQSECCVQETSLSALKAGLGVTLLHGAHSTYDTADCSAEEIEASVEKLLCSRGAQVLDFEAAVRSWKAAGMVE